MKRTVLIFVLFALLLSACGSSRDLSTPSSRLVGHWISDKPKLSTGGYEEYFFSAVDPDTGIGKMSSYTPTTGEVTYLTYKIQTEAPAGEALDILVTLFEGVDSPFNRLTFDFEIAKDGLTAKMLKFTITYIDDKTEFDPSDREPTDIPTQTPTLDPSITVYQVAIDGVEFYETSTSDTAQYVLGMEDRLIPADGAFIAECIVAVRDGKNRNMCHMYSPRLGVDGWVWRFMIVEVD
jgi:hypothetical protein